MIVSSNATALQVLRGLDATKPLYEAGTWERPPNHGPWFGTGLRGPVEPISDVTKEAMAKIVAIVGEGQSVDLTGRDYTHASISGKDHATIIGGEGNDSIGAMNYAVVIGAGGSDSIGVYDYGKVDGGAGDDFIAAGNDAEIIAGDGDDWVTTNYRGKVDLGNGDDFLYGYTHMQVDGGAGNDEIRVADYSSVDGGEGDDLIVTNGNSTVKGGAGNDIIVAGAKSGWGREYSDIDGGEGDDYLQIDGNSTANGGLGNDTIRLMAAGSTVTFAKGDGQDAIMSKDDFTLKLSGYSRDDVIVAQRDELMIVSFRSSDDTITLNLAKGANAELVLEDGSSLVIAGTEADRKLTYLWTSVSWALDEPFQVRNA